MSTLLRASANIRAVYVDTESITPFAGETVIAWQIPDDERAPIAIGTHGPCEWADGDPAYLFADGHVESEGEFYRSLGSFQRRLRRWHKRLAKRRAMTATQAST